MTQPEQNRGRSEQNYETPDEFITAVKNLFGIDEFAIDLAASSLNSKGEFYYSEFKDSLDPSCKWEIPEGSYAWLNPPYSSIEPWVIKSFFSRDKCRTLVLVPASVGSNWFRDWVFNKANVIFLNGRITFVGCNDPYPKDCMLLVYGKGITPVTSVWDWRKGRMY